MSFLMRLFGLDEMDRMAKVVWRKPPEPGPPPPEGYRVFTSEFDEAITLPQIPARVEPLTAKQLEEFAETKRQYARLYQPDRLQTLEMSGSFIRRLVGKLSQEERARTVVSILIDHSGSMRGMGILSACLAADVASRALDRCGVATEIIGFTTRSWKGGQSRAKWIKQGSPPNPGRLCDLRHILYRTTKDPRGRAPSFVDALYPGLLKENIDGEAILYAVERLEEGNWQRKAVVVVSDGAPVDDSTIASNSDKEILTVHLKQVIDEVRTKGIGLGYVMLEERAGDFIPENCAVALEPVAAGKALLDVIARALDLDPDQSPLDPSGA